MDRIGGNYEEHRQQRVDSERKDKYRDQTEPQDKEDDNASVDSYKSRESLQKEKEAVDTLHTSEFLTQNDFKSFEGVQDELGVVANVGDEELTAATVGLEEAKDALAEALQATEALGELEESAQVEPSMEEIIDGGGVVSMMRKPLPYMRL